MWLLHEVSVPNHIGLSVEHLSVRITWQPASLPQGEREAALLTQPLKLHSILSPISYQLPMPALFIVGGDYTRA